MAELNSNYFASDFFVYEIDFTALTAGSSQTSSFTIQADADFFCTKLTAMGLDDTGAVIVRDEPFTASVLITDTASGRNLSNIAVPVSNLFGSGELPFILPRQRIFQANGVVSVQVNNFGAADIDGLRLSFIGEKMFRR